MAPYPTTSRSSGSIHDTPWTKRLAFLHRPQKHLLDTSKLYARKKKVEEEEEEEEFEEEIVAEYEEEEDEEYYVRIMPTKFLVFDFILFE